MIWPFRPHAPVPLKSRVACERNFAALAQLLERHRIPDLPAVTPADLQDRISDPDRDSLPQRLFEFMGVRIPISVHDVRLEWAASGALDMHGQPVFYDLALGPDDRVASVQFHPLLSEFPYRLAAMTATVAAACYLRVASRQRFSIAAHEIFPLFFGFGPIMANAGLYDAAEWDVAWHLANKSRTGAVGPVELGYCMALADWSLSTHYESVAAVLRPDAKGGLKQGLKFLRRTGDCCFPQDFLFHAADRSTAVQRDELDGRGHSNVLRTLEELYESQHVPADLVEPVSHLLRHSQPDIQQAAALVLSQCEALPRAIHDELLMLAERGAAGTRRAAITALRPGYDNDSDALDLLTDLLRSNDTTTAQVCITTLLEYPSCPDQTLDALLSALGGMMSRSASVDLTGGMALLQRLHDDPSEAIENYFSADPTALAILHEFIENSGQPAHDGAA